MEVLFLDVNGVCPVNFAAVINSQEALSSFVGDLDQAPWVALDTEADSLHAYPEKLCLIQISIPGNDVLVDPLSGMDLKGLFESLDRHTLLMHGSDYDIRLFKMGHNFVPNTVFDTMLAARIAGRTHFGLSRLASEILEVELEKTSQKANWAKRPLTDRMREYALNDTRYLKPLVDALAGELNELGRADWHKQECDRLVRVNSTIQDPDQDKIWRIKGSARLDPVALSVLKGLWHWREKEARRRNRPPYFVLSPEVIVKISEEATQEGDIAKWLPRRIPDYRRREIQKCIKSSMSMPNNEWPERHKSPPRKHITPHQKKRFEEIQRKRDKEAADLAIDPTIIASRATMVRLSCEAEGVFDDVLPWQQEVLEIC